MAGIAPGTHGQCYYNLSYNSTQVNGIGRASDFLLRTLLHGVNLLKKHFVLLPI